MYTVRVQGYDLPRRLAGHPALDFCNTWAGWGQPPNPRCEWLKDYDRLAVWSGHVELADAAMVATLRAAAAREPSTAGAVLSQARVLRGALYDVLTNPTPGDAFEVVAVMARKAAATLELVDTTPDVDVGTPGGRIASWRVPASARLEFPLLAVAWSAADLLTSQDRGKVRRCPGSDCGWLFIDRRGRRRWCSMGVCGNRAKVRAHAARVRRDA